jgi:hypothetical protein
MGKDADITSDDETEIIAKRMEKRYVTKAQARMSKAELLLKNISLHGGCVQGEEFVDAAPNEKNVMAIIPEKESKIKEFDVDIISKWIRLNKKRIESGFIIMPPAESELLEEYVEYLKNKNKEEVME